MADLRLAVMAFPQQWDGATLRVNLLVIPSVDPLLDPVAAAGTVAFADSVPALRPVVIPNLDSVPTTADAAALRVPLSLVAPPAPVSPRPMFEQLAAQAGAQGVTIKPSGGVAPPSVSRIRKALPQSYVDVTGSRPNGDTTTTGHDYHCALAEQKPGPITPRPRESTWGQLISFALRQPALANALGLRYEIDVPFAGDLSGGGWVFVELDPADPWASAAAAGEIRLYAGRLPSLLPAVGRPVFGAVLFPVDTAGGAIDPSATSEADTYASGFAQVVHSHQPEANATVTGAGSPLPVAADPGVQLGWDDEQVVAWTNGQLGVLQAKADHTLDAETPLGVLGYRVDAADITTRLPGDASPLPWESLMTVSTALPFGLGTVTQELQVEPAPIRMNTGTPDAWLPHYFADWRGGCIAVADDVPRQMLGAAPAATANTPEAVDTLLSYGHTYAFRVRLSDLSHGGPRTDQAPVDPGPADVSTLEFVRMTPPKSVRLALTADALTVTRPVIGYPEVLYTSLGASAADRATIAAHYVTAAASAPARSGQVAGVPDPDVVAVRITVEVAAPAHDAAGPGSTLDGTFRVLYTTTRDLPPLPPGPTPADPGLTVDLAYVDAASVDTWSPGGPGDPPWPTTGPLVVPRARTVHLRVEPVLRPQPGYYGPGAERVLPATVELRAEARSEPSLLIRNDEGGEPVRGMLFRRPAGAGAPSVPAQLADELRLVASGLTLSARPGQRVVFGASKAVRHEISGDGGSITLASESELTRNWIVAVEVDLARDWTWTGLAEPVTVSRDGEVVGSITVPFVASPAATADPAHWDRERTRLVFFDAVDPHEPTASGFPEALPHTWVLGASVTTEAGAPHGVAGTPTYAHPVPGSSPAELVGVPLPVTLPIALPPKQVPELASVGIALSPYTVGAGYASTGERQRALWLELRTPVDNVEGDALFARVVGHGADPLLYDATPSTFAPVEPGLTLDPELLRLVVPGDSDDRSGINAMVRLEKATDSDLHYLLPLPPGVAADSPELFGFWTWELRIGHAGDPHAPGQKWWSTAQARFGRPLRVNGVQHPAPPLACSAGRMTLETNPGAEYILATAPYATPVLNGRPLVTAFDQPKTTMCFLLYAQVVQSDGSSNRNVLLQHRYGQWEPPEQREIAGRLHTQRDRVGRAMFEVREVEQLLFQLGLPANSPLSMIAVELLPGGTGAGNLPKQRDVGLAAVARDPLGHDLLPDGRPQRILRVSPLVAVAPAC
ncbi:MAG TPA: hypothetical protein VFJ85_07340 [Acidimicrobiales bacterium]|nr:hypothetical protein [Acidimicrobiales bacterium]